MRARIKFALSLNSGSSSALSYLCIGLRYTKLRTSQSITSMAYRAVVSFDLRPGNDQPQTLRHFWRHLSSSLLRHSLTVLALDRRKPQERQAFLVPPDLRYRTRRNRRKKVKGKCESSKGYSRITIASASRRSSHPSRFCAIIVTIRMIRNV